MPHMRLELRAGQNLALVPRLQQSVRLLQLSSIALNEELRQALGANPMLEEEDDAPTDPTLATLSDLQSPSGDDGPITTPAADDGPDPTDELVHASGTSQGGAEGDDWPSREAAAGPTLHEHLHGQLCQYRLDPRMRTLVQWVIESLDDDGYLRFELNELQRLGGEEMPVDIGELSTALSLVQHLDPPGVGARDLSECLRLQLEALPSDVAHRALAVTIATDHLAALGRRDFRGLRRQLRCDDDALRAAHGLIRHCDPHPGWRFGSTPTEYITPDLIVRKRRGHWTPFLNPATTPRIRVNRQYADLLHQSRVGAHTAISQQLQEARFLVRQVEQRFVTIQRVADAIVARQHRFFDYGDVALKPLTLQEVADDLALHESTISRATSGKYMATPHGLVELKHFFSRPLTAADGGRCSPAAVRVLVRELVASESPAAPYSDVDLTEMLARQGVRVARRTVTKYRALLKIPSAELRRER